MEEAQGLLLTEENIELVLDEIRPYLVGEKPVPQTNQIPTSQHIHCWASWKYHSHPN